MSSQKPLWRVGLELTTAFVSVERFRRELPGLREKCRDDPARVGLYFFGLLAEWLISSIGLFAVIELSAEEIPAALAETRTALDSLDFERELKRCKRKEKPYYEAFARLAKKLTPLLSAAMEALLNRYVSGDYDVAQNPNALIQEALSIAEEDLERAKELITHGAAIALHGHPEHPLWWRWRSEAFGLAEDWLFLTTNLVWNYIGQGRDPLGSFTELQASRQAAMRELAASAVEEPESPESKEMLKKLVSQLIEQGEAGFTPEQCAWCETNRDEAIPALIKLATYEALQWEESPGGGYAPVSAVQLLGELRAEEAVPDLIDIVADHEPDTLIVESALEALRQIGQPAVRPILEFLRYSRDMASQVMLAMLLTDIVSEESEENEQIFQAIAQVWERATWEDEKADLAYPLSHFGGERAIPLIQQGIADPNLESWDDYDELAYTLRELGVEPPPPPEHLEMPDDELDEVKDEGVLRFFMLNDPDRLMRFAEQLPAERHLSAEEIAELFGVIEQNKIFILIALQCIVFAEKMPPSFLDRILVHVEDLQFDADLEGYPEWMPEAYAHLADFVTSTVAPRIVGVILAVKHYLTHRYDIAEDPDQLLVAARPLSSPGDEWADEDYNKLEELFGRAGALILHGRPFWSRWPLETDWPLSEWLAGLFEFYKILKNTGHIPLFPPSPRQTDYTEADVQEIVHSLMDQTLGEEPWENAPPAVSQLIEQLIARGSDHLPEAERRPFIYQRSAVTPYLIRLVEDKEYWYTDGPGEGWAAILAIRLLGELRASQAAETLVNVVADSAPQDILHSAAIFSLIHIGRPALPAVQAYFRYGRDIRTLTALAEVLGCIGQRDPESFDMLRRVWENVKWRDNRRMVALAFGDLRDRRAVPLLRSAFQDPQADALDRDYVWWALQQLGIPLPMPEVEDTTLKTPGPLHVRLVYSGDRVPLRLRYTPWGEALCPDCGKPLVLDAEGSWKHQERPSPLTSASGPRKRKRRKR